MTTARTAESTLAALLLAGSLVACGTTTAAAPKTVPDLATALTVEIDGFAPADVPEPPATVCHDPDHNSDAVPTLPRSLGEPTGVGYSGDDADLHAWAWRTATPEAAATAVDEAVADIDGCRFQITVDYDTDGDGDIDAGGSEEQTAVPWSDENWTGLSASGRFSDDSNERVESRFGRHGDVVVLVVLTVAGNDDALLPTVDSYLDEVAARLP
jgi:hypothetical protein